MVITVREENYKEGQDVKELNQKIKFVCTVSVYGQMKIDEDE